MLYKGTNPAALYRGAYKPGRLYKGTQLVAGYADAAKAAPASWDGTYDDVVGVAATGKGKQQTYSGAQLLDISTCTINSVKPYNLTITRDGDVVRIQSTAVSGDVGGWYSFVLLWMPNADLSGKGYVITPFLLQGSIEKVYGLRNAEETSIACVLILTEGEAVDVALRLMVSVDTPTAYEPYVGGQPSPSPDYPQPLVAAEGALTASGRTGTTPTTVTLPTLRAIPGSDIRDTLTYIGDGRWKVTRRVGVVQFAGAGTENWTIGGLKADKSDWYYQSPALTDAVNTAVSDSACTHYPAAIISNNQTKQGCGVVWRAVRVRWGDPPDGTDAWKAFLMEQAAAGTPMTVWYTLATPTAETVTLGTLPSYPVHTELAVSGDYPPDVTGTVKVGT